MTNAVFGFTSILLGILEYEKPEYLAVAFDMKGPTFRHAELADYKGTRAKTDDDLISQFPIIHEMMDTWEIPKFGREGLEADDFIGIIATELEEKYDDIEIIIVTGDQDALQLVTERTTVVAPISLTANAVAIKVKEGTMTSSPRPISAAKRASFNAVVPESTPIA